MIDAHDKAGSISLKSRISKLLFAGFLIVSLSTNIQTIKLMQSRSNDAPSISPIAFESQPAAQASDPLDTVAQAGEVPNDDIDHATSIDTLPFSDSLDTTQATTAADDPVTTCGASDPATQSKSVWYVFVPEERSRIKVSTVGSEYDTVVNVWTGTRGNLISRTCDYDTEGTLLSFWAYQDTTYYIEVMAYGDTPGGQLEISVDLQPPPPNDDFDDAMVIETLPFFDDTDAALATTASDDPATTCGSSDPATQSKSVWYVFVPEEDARIKVSTMGSDYQTVVQVWTGTRGNLSPVACKSHYKGTLLRFWANRETTYYIEVMGYGDYWAGQLEFLVEIQPPPANDDFDHAIVVETLPFTDNQDTALATTASDDPATTCGASDPATQSYSVWYQYTPLEDEWIEIDTRWSDYNTVLQIWTGVRGELTPVACNDDSPYYQQAELIVKFLKDVPYYIEVMSYGATEGGELEFQMEIEPPPYHDDFDNARTIVYLPHYDRRSTLTATTAPDDPSPSCGANEPSTQSNSVWYRFDAPYDGALVIDTEGSEYETVVAVWTGERGDLEEEACALDPVKDDPIILPVGEDYRYWIEVMQYGEPGGGNLVLLIDTTIWEGKAIGLRGDYFNNNALQEPITFTRYDGSVHFHWSGSGPSQELGNDFFSTRWTGYVEPEFSELYTFYTYSDDGVRLWVDNQLLIDNWTIHGATWDEGSIDLEGGRKYSLKLEYFDQEGSSVIYLRWSSPSQYQRPVPTNRLSYLALDDSSITIQPQILPADGVSACTVNINLKDSLGNIGTGFPVELYVSGSGNRVNGTPVAEDAWTHIGLTDAAGSISAELASVVAGEKDMRLRVDNAIVDVDAEVTFTATAVTQLRVILPGEEPLAGQDPGKSGTAVDALVEQRIPFMVQAVDQNWNLVTDYSGTVDLTSTDPAASLPESLELLNGEAISFIEWSTSGTHTLSAASIDEPAIVGESILDVVDETLTVADGEVVTLDDARYAMTEVLETGEDILPYDGTEGFQPGGEVLIITMLGEDMGVYETNHLMIMEEDQIRLAEPLFHSYDGTRDKVMIQQVPYYPTVTIQSGGKLTAHMWDDNTGGVLFLRAGGVTVEPGGMIDVSELGFTSGEGPGSGDGGAGGGYGGYGNGGYRGDPAGGIGYGSVNEPFMLGSAGGGCTPHMGKYRPGGRGGGVVRLVISGELLLDGNFSAHGESSDGCRASGAGGSIWLQADHLLGEGYIGANAGDAVYQWGNRGSGSGGRIALYATSINYTGGIESATGNRGAPGGPGTIFFENTATGWRKLYIDNLGRGGRSAVLTDPTETSWTFDEIELVRNGDLEQLDPDDRFLLASDIMIGDGTATLYLNGDLEFEGEELQGFSLHGDEDVTMSMPAELTVRGVSVTHYGVLEGVSSLILASDPASDSIMRLGASGHSSDEVEGTFVFDQITIESGGVLELASDVQNERGLTLVSTSIDIQEGGRISGDGLGYSWEAGDPGPGAGGGEAGGGHGGYGGGEDGGEPYGSIYESGTLGSAGGGELYDNDPPGQPGGGAIRLMISDTLLVDGVLSANGIVGEYQRGAGAGGSLWITVETLTGSGAIQANGGDGSVYGGSTTIGSGSGGRIAAYIKENVFNGAWEAAGGVKGAAYGVRGMEGGPGTIYIEDTDTGFRKLVVDNQDQDGPPAAILSDPDVTTWAFDELHMIRYGHLELVDPEDELIFTPENIIGDGTAQLHLHGTYSFDRSSLTSIGFFVREDATLTLLSDFELDQVRLTNEGEVEGVSRLTLKGAKLINRGELPALTSLSLTSVDTKDSYVHLTTSGNTVGDPAGTYSIDNLSIDADQLLELAGDPATGSGVTLQSETILISGHLSADGLGYTRYGNGPGAPVENGGAGHGGIGSGIEGGGDAYGSLTQPLTLGSAARGSGGGAIRLIVSDELIISGTGLLSANAETDWYHGGAGGSLWISAETLQGSGRIQANGSGLTNYGMSGAGGRIAAYFNDNQFTGSWEVAAGESRSPGGPGTIYLENTHTGKRELIIDNLGRDGRRAVISNPDSTVWEFEQITLQRFGNLELRDPDDTILLAAENLAGDGTAQLFFHGDLSYDLTELRAIGFHLFEGATLTLPEEVSFHGVRVDNAGTIAGLSELEMHGATFTNTGVISDLTSLSVQSQDERNSLLLLTAQGRSASQPQGTYVFGDMVLDPAQRIELKSDPEIPLGVTILADDVTVAGHLSADASGYTRENPGPGAPSTNWGGAGHGGIGGGEGGGPNYGSAQEPGTLGSASLGAGGGAIRLSLEGTLLLAPEGFITANGEDSYFTHGNYGGGAGGSIWITAPQVLGAGTIQANGGDGTYSRGGGGGGGRIKIEAGNTSPDLMIQALGGEGDGGDGEQGSAIVESIDFPTDVMTGINGPGEIVAGMTFEYTLTVKNVGLALAEEVTLTDTLPPEIVYLQKNAPVALDEQGNQLTWVFGDLDPGETVVFSALVQSPVEIPEGTLITTTVEVSTTTDETDVENNLAQFGTLFVSGYVFETDLEPAELPLEHGATGVFRINIENVGLLPDTYTVAVEGLDAEWFELSETSLSLAPGASSQIELVVRVEDCGVAGTVPFTIDVSSMGGIEVQTLQGALDLQTQPAIYGLNPIHDTTVGSRDVTFLWNTKVPTSGVLTLYPVDQPEEAITLSSEESLAHAIRVEDLTRNTTYEWFVEATSACGMSQSEPQTFTVGNGIVFVEHVISDSIERDYDQWVWVAVENQDSISHTVKVEVQNPFDDLFLNFIGSGSIDQTITLLPSERHFMRLAIHAQDAGSREYDLVATLVADEETEEPIRDAASVHLRVLFEADFTLEEVSIDPITGVRTFRVTNHGASITDLSISAEETGTGLPASVYITPTINHAYLKTDQSLSFEVWPIFGPEDVAGSASTANNAVAQAQALDSAYEILATVGDFIERVEVDRSCPEGKQVYAVTRENVCMTFPNGDWYCTNRPKISIPLDIPYYVNPQNIIGAKLRISFDPKSDGVRSHTVNVEFNGEPVLSLQDTIPSGSYEVALEPSSFNPALLAGTVRQNVRLRSEHMNGGHYVVASHIELQVAMDTVTLYVCAGSQAEAEAIVDDQMINDCLPEPGDVAVEILAPEPGGVAQPREDGTINLKAFVTDLQSQYYNFYQVEATIVYLEQEGAPTETLDLYDDGNMGRNGDIGVNDRYFNGLWFPQHDGQVRLMVNVAAPNGASAYDYIVFDVMALPDLTVERVWQEEVSIINWTAEIRAEIANHGYPVEGPIPVEFRYYSVDDETGEPIGEPFHISYYSLFEDETFERGEVIEIVDDGFTPEETDLYFVIVVVDPE